VPLTDAVTALRGEKTYELANHLGNVLAVVSDALAGDAPNVVSATAIFIFVQYGLGTRRYKYFAMVGY
jgi:hypothetical protein